MKAKLETIKTNYVYKIVKKCEVKNEDKVNQFYKDKTKLQK